MKTTFPLKMEILFLKNLSVFQKKVILLPQSAFTEKMQKLQISSLKYQYLVPICLWVDSNWHEVVMRPIYWEMFGFVYKCIKKPKA